MNDLWKFDFEPNDWTEVPAGTSPPARHSHAATAYDRKLYIFGGVGANGNILTDAWVYDPATNNWTQLTQQGQLPEGRYRHSAVPIGNRIYIFGGLTQGGGLTLDYAYSFDPATGAWQERASAFASRAGHSAAVYSDKMYIWGGQTYANALLNTMRAYDPQQNSWTTVSQLGATIPPSRTLQSTAWDGSKMYVLQGRGLEPIFGDISVFDFLTSQWVPAGAMYAAYQGAAAAFQSGSGGSQASAPAATRTKILLFGGLKDGQALSTQVLVDPLLLRRLYLPAILRNSPR